MSTARAAARGIVRKAVFQGDRELRSSCTRFANDFRALRIRAGLSQAATGRAVGVDRSVICRLEAGDESVSPAIRARAAALLGAEFRMALYPLGATMILDAAQARAIEMILQLRDPRWKAIVEAPVPGPGRRSSSSLNSRAGSLIGKRSFESVTRNARPSSRVWTRIARSTWCWRCHHRDAIERWSGNTRG